MLCEEYMNFQDTVTSGCFFELDLGIILEVIKPPFGLGLRKSLFQLCQNME
jgi:hypothetical protein